MEKVLITGAGGYIGSNAADYFVRQGYAVTGTIHRNVNGCFLKSGAESLNIDLRDPSSLEALFSSREYDYVLHIAALASDVGRDSEFRETNYNAVQRLAALSMKHGVKRFVYLSTADVYGLHDFNGETEEMLGFDDSVTNPYPKYKIMSEKWLAENISPDRYACVRPCVVFGNGDTTITPRTVSYIRSSPVVLHFGKWKGENRWPLAHVENVCRALHAAMLVPEAGGKGVTVLDSKRTTLREYYLSLAKEFLPGKAIREAVLPKALAIPVAWFSTRLSNLLSRHTPLFDPTLYALDTITHNLDFSNSRMLEWLKAASLKEYVCDSYR